CGRKAVITGRMENNILCTSQATLRRRFNKAAVTGEHLLRRLAVQVDEIRGVYTQRHLMFFRCRLDFATCFIGSTDALHPCDLEMTQSECFYVGDRGGRAGADGCAWRTDCSETKQVVHSYTLSHGDVWHGPLAKGRATRTETLMWDM